MQYSAKETTQAIFSFYSEMCRTGEFGDFTWADRRKRFTVAKANAFFVGVLLDQGQKAERAWDGGRHLVANHYQGQPSFWERVRQADDQELRSICRSGFEGKSYASVYCVNKFPDWLRSAANQMGEQYDNDPRNIWDVRADQVQLIYDRVLAFDGIGDALAKMAQFILVRNFGIAGGKINQSQMSVKPDVLVRRVLYRSGLAESEGIQPAVSALDSLRLRRPADFDAALWTIGREFCLKSKPACENCPINDACAKTFK
jgi:endonuclease III